MLVVLFYCIKQARFNRYIVECKLKRTLSLYIGNVRFNRYIVECKCGVVACCVTVA